MENGRSPEENQVSSTSSSENEGNYQDTTLNRTGSPCFRTIFSLGVLNFFAALSSATSSVVAL